MDPDDDADAELDAAFSRPDSALSVLSCLPAVPPRFSLFPRSASRPAEAHHEEVTSWDAHETAPPPAFKMLAGYLVRMGMDVPHMPMAGRRARTSMPLWDTFRHLHRMHTIQIPCANLSFEGEEQGLLDPASIYKKMIGWNNGGNNYESNMMFGWVLQQHLGCQVDHLEAFSFHRESQKPNALPDHICLVVHLNGMAWLADVAGCCGVDGRWKQGGFTEPLLLEDSIEQIQDSGRYRVRASGCATGSQGTLSSEYIVEKWSPATSASSSCSSEASLESPLSTSPVIVRSYSRSEDVGVWEGMYRFAMWPRSREEIERVYKKHQNNPRSPVFERRVVSRTRAESEGGGRLVLYEQQMLFLTDDGRFRRRVVIGSREEYAVLLRQHFSMTLPEPVPALVPEEREERMW